ncbi:preprotein translocase subunit YajC [Hyphobacterium sp. SN044]|uniref:preprotein translocase subunit YajC n=1 Tax=Hyphobacterium sp. SN044 TaxID=2912575 RepID=UPI001F02DAC6|nr:preprotein translocase subunit YajC [Hyphobacterium sp. SN044]MCF8879360.1 preprotein translocase subunit YajC [Hyphobacterium sp. SN044]
MFENIAYAASAAGAGAEGGLGYLLIQIFPFILLFAVLYFVMIRPQQKRMKEHRELIASVKRGDQIVTSGGLIGKVTKVEETEVTVEFAKDVQVQVVKSTIAEVRGRTAPKPANDSGSNGDKPAPRTRRKAKDNSTVSGN